MSYVKTLTYVFHVIFRPFDGFWDLKKEHRGSLAASITIVLLTIATLTIEKQNTAFLFNTNRLQNINVMVDIITVVLLYVLWVVANWCLTTLMDGEGSMKDIAIATGYALFPIVLIHLPLVGFSHLIITDEGSFYYVLMSFSYLWTGFLLFFSMMITHQYSMGKTLFTIILTIVGMAVILFIGLLFFNVIQQVVNFVMTIYTELRFR